MICKGHTFLWFFHPLDKDWVVDSFCFVIFYVFGHGMNSIMQRGHFSMLFINQWKHCPETAEDVVILLIQKKDLRTWFLHNHSFFEGVSFGAFFQNAIHTTICLNNKIFKNETKAYNLKERRHVSDRHRRHSRFNPNVLCFNKTLCMIWNKGTLSQHNTY